MDVEVLVRCLDSRFYSGVPDSQLLALCSYLESENNKSQQHIIAANEGNAVALAAGYYLATGNYPVVYMQNSGIGNAVNPITSLTNDNVYAIPCIYVIGWRGEPKIHDEPQHVFQGEITLPLLGVLDIATFVVSTDTREIDIINVMEKFRLLLECGKSVAFIIRKNALTYEGYRPISNHYKLCREEAIKLSLIHI